MSFGVGSRRRSARYAIEIIDSGGVKVRRRFTPELRARTHQVISILDSYAYRSLVWDIYVERVSVPKDGGVSDERKIRDAIPRAITCLTALQQIMLAGPFLTGPALTLADLHAAPMFTYFTVAPEAHQLLALYPVLRNGGIGW
jgi:glutathione S-transferase